MAARHIINHSKKNNKHGILRTPLVRIFSIRLCSRWRAGARANQLRAGRGFRLTVAGERGDYLALALVAPRHAHDAQKASPMKLATLLSALLGQGASASLDRVEPALQCNPSSLAPSMADASDRIEPDCALPARGAGLIERLQWNLSTRG
jgi:hypothetical protein